MIDGTGTRVIWEAPDRSVRLCCRIWEAGGSPAYGVQTFEGYWRWAETEDEQRRGLVAVARWLDQASRDREADISSRTQG